MVEPRPSAAFRATLPSTLPSTLPASTLPAPLSTTPSTTLPVDREQLITEHLPLVGHIARETAARLPRHLGTDDLTGAGALALVQAAHGFDPGLGVPFARFASTRIRGAMIDQMRQRDWATRSVRSRARALASTEEALLAALGREPSDAELAAAVGMSEAELRSVRSGADRATLLSLDPVAADGEGLGSVIPDTGPQPDEALVAAERMGYLRDAVAELPERLRFVVTAYYLQQRPLTEIADELKVTQSRASQLRAEGLELLREALQTLLPDDARVGVPAAHAAVSGTGAGTAADTPVAVPQQAPAAEASAGIRARRREAYVNAVARRSGVAQRADVQTYLDGNTFDGALI